MSIGILKAVPSIRNSESVVQLSQTQYRISAQTLMESKVDSGDAKTIVHFITLSNNVS